MIDNQLPTPKDYRMVRTYEYYECPNCLFKWDKDQMGNAFEECPVCGELCELKRDCENCYGSMDADYDRKVWHCSCCKIIVTME